MLSASSLEDLYACNRCRCGFCVDGCPSYRATRLESRTARGRVQVTRGMVEGRYESRDGAALREILTTCLSCGYCSSRCGTDISRFIIEARAAAVEKYGMSAMKKMAVNVIRRPTLMGALVGCARFSQAVGLLRAIPFARALGRVSTRGLTGTGGAESGSGGPKAVLLYAGCLVNHAFTGVGRATLRVFSRVGVRLEVPGGHRCCGWPALVSGDFATARELGLHFLRTFGKADRIVTVCPTCLTMIREGYLWLFEGDAKLAPQFRDLAARAVDCTSELFRLGGIDGRVSDPRVVTYHDPCHLRWRAGLVEEPRVLLRCINGIELREMAEPGCCGFAGLFALEHKDISRWLAAEKLKQINATGAEAVVTGCPGCVVGIREALMRVGRTTRVFHTMEVLASV